MAEVRLEGLAKTFGRAEVIRGLDLAIPHDALTVIVGPSGCGKSTLLRLIAGLEEPTAGTVRIGGRDVTDLPPARRGIAMVFQSYALYPHMTAFENMAFGLKLAGRGREAVAAKVREAAGLLQIGELLDRKPRDLSGGQRQRVAIGRAIVRDPQVFLFDEPLSNLDAALRVQMRFELARLRDRLGATMVYVTHDQTEAMTLGHRIVVLKDGRIEQVGTPLDLYWRPANLFVAGFIGSPAMNVLEARPAGIAAGRVALDLPGGRRIDAALAPGTAAARADKAVLGVRPEHVRFARRGEEPDLAGRVLVVERLGGETVLYVECPGAATVVVVVRTVEDPAAAPGDAAALVLDRSACHVFDDRGIRISADRDEGSQTS
jgi:multiple sugar transport system ATP-binding protein